MNNLSSLTERQKLDMHLLLGKVTLAGALWGVLSVASMVTPPLVGLACGLAGIGAAVWWGRLVDQVWKPKAKEEARDVFGGWW